MTQATITLRNATHGTAYDLDLGNAGYRNMGPGVYFAIQKTLCPDGRKCASKCRRQSRLAISGPQDEGVRVEDSGGSSVLVGHVDSGAF